MQEALEHELNGDVDVYGYDSVGEGPDGQDAGSNVDYVRESHGDQGGEVNGMNHAIESDINVNAGDVDRTDFSGVLLAPPSPPRNDSDVALLDASEPLVAGSTKRKRVVLSIYDKQQVLQRLDAGEQPMHVARAFGISRQQVSDIKRNRSRIAEYCADAKHINNLRRKTLTAPSTYHPGVEQGLYQWLVRQRSLERIVTPETLAHKATELFIVYASGDPNVSHKSIANWLKHFKRVHNLRVLNVDELARLPSRFVSAMDMTQPPGMKAESKPNVVALAAPPPAAAAAAALKGPSAMNSNNSVASTAPAITPTTTTAPLTTHPLLLNTALALHAPSPAPQQQHQQMVVPTPPLPLPQLQPPLLSPPTTPQQLRLTASALLLQDLSTQLAFFEREATAKLDYMDARVEKLCFLVLPQRFD